MPDITLDFRILDVDGHDIVDPAVTVRLGAINSSHATLRRFAVNGHPVRFTMEAPAGSALLVRVSTSRYRDSQSFGTVGNGVLTLKDPVLVPRRPDAWLPTFTRWDALAPEFGSMLSLLDNSPSMRLGRDSATAAPIKERYDAAGPHDESGYLAKMCLLNLCGRLRTEAVPGGHGVWLDEIQQLLVAQRDRCFGVVSERFFKTVVKLAATPDTRYKRTNHKNHKARIEALEGVSQIGEMASIKSRDSKGNVQLTVAKAKLGGGSAFLLDADVDEQGEWLGHTFEFIRNFLTGHETHPIDIYEAFRKDFPAVTLGYGLDVRTPVAEVTARIVAARDAARPPIAVGRATSARAKTGKTAPRRIAVLGDSVPWGQGLLNAQKMHEIVADAYGAQGTRPAVTLVAHSGAVIGVGMPSTGAVCHGEVPKARPTILQQVAGYDAVEAKTVDLVLLNGGINDVDVRVILDPRTSTTTLADRTARACGDDLLVLVRAAMKTFPKARIGVLAYYPVLSRLSRFGEGQQFVIALGAPPPLLLPGVDMSALNLWDTIVGNCRVFHEASTTAIQGAVQKANAESPGRCVMVDPGFREEHAALAPEARLFGINWDFTPQDPVAHQRRLACDRCEQHPLRRLQCYLASAGHPNALGAEDYARAIVTALA